MGNAAAAEDRDSPGSGVFKAPKPYPETKAGFGRRGRAGGALCVVGQAEYGGGVAWRVGGRWGPGGRNGKKGDRGCVKKGWLSQLGWVEAAN